MCSVSIICKQFFSEFMKLWKYILSVKVRKHKIAIIYRIRIPAFHDFFQRIKQEQNKIKLQFFKKATEFWQALVFEQINE